MSARLQLLVVIVLVAACSGAPTTFPESDAAVAPMDVSVGADAYRAPDALQTKRDAPREAEAAVDVPVDVPPDSYCMWNVQTDVLSCGRCGLACRGFENATVICVRGVCTMGECMRGYVDCDRNPANGCEAYLSGDINNCGACGYRCQRGLMSTRCVAAGCARL